MDYVKYRAEGPVAVITIDRPEALNALNAQVLEELAQTLAAIDLDTVRAVVLTGAGEKAFVAGADITAMRGMSPAEARQLGRLGNNVMRQIEQLEVPVIAAVNGYALGGGCELAMACDIRLAAENAVFAQPEAGLGITAGFGGTQRLPRLVGEGMAKQLLYTCERLGADRALAIGLVNAVLPAGQLMDAAMALAGKIAANAPIAVRATKKAVNVGRQTDIDSGIALEVELFGSCFATADQQNAMGAFVEKRKPEPFVNR